MQDLSRVFQYRAYTLYFFAASISWFGSAMQLIAVSWLIMDITEANYSIALVLLFSSLPNALFSPIFGVFADRFNRKFLAVSMDIFRGVILLCIPFLSFFNLLQGWHLYLFLFLEGIGEGIHDPSVRALLVELIPRKMLLSANSMNSVSNQIGGLIGAACAGILISLFSPITVVAINSFSYFFSACCFLCISKTSTHNTEVTHKEREWKIIFIEMKEGFEYIRQNPNIISNYLILFLLLTTVRTINVLLPPFAKHVLEVGAAGFGYIEAAYAAGAVVSGFFISKLSKAYGLTQIMTIGVWTLSSSLILFGASYNLLTAVLGYFMIGLTIQVRLLYLTEAQKNTSLDYQGRVYSLFNTSMSTASLAIYTIMGFLVDIFPLRWFYFFQSLIIATAAILAYQINFSRESQ